MSQLITNYNIMRVLYWYDVYCCVFLSIRVVLLVYKTQLSRVALIFFINLIVVKCKYNECDDGMTSSSNNWWTWSARCIYTNRPTWRHQHGFISSGDWLASPRWRLHEAAWILMKLHAKTGSLEVHYGIISIWQHLPSFFFSS